MAILLTFDSTLISLKETRSQVCVSKAPHLKRRPKCHLIEAASHPHHNGSPGLPQMHCIRSPFIRKPEAQVRFSPEYELSSASVPRELAELARNGSTRAKDVCSLLLESRGHGRRPLGFGNGVHDGSQAQYGATMPPGTYSRLVRSASYVNHALKELPKW